MSDLTMSNQKESKGREMVKRILLTDQQAKQVSDLLCRLRADSCRVDTSKIVNEILSLFFNKYEELEFQFLKGQFFDKKSYLKKLIQSASSENIDESIMQYINKSVPTKRRGRKTNSSKSKKIDEESPST
ncbi:MAG: hypothetical protein KDD45_02460 [Bdellovibrionales bacterium]|nr:hypothetical protein [Bdellovibrionales bacterium]